MPKKPTVVAPAAIVPPSTVTSLAAIVAMTLKEQCARFAERATVSQMAFAEMGKLHRSISDALAGDKKKTVYGELRKLGVKDGSISNASYASRVLGMLVIPAIVTEAVFDTFTFQDCLAICRVSGPKAQRQLSAEEIAVVITENLTDFAPELNCYNEHGISLEEKATAVAAEAARVEAERVAAEQAKADKIAADQQAAVDAAVAEAARAIEAARGSSTPSAAAVPTAPATNAATPPTPSIGSTAPASTTPSPAAPAATNVPQAPPKAKEAPTAPPTNITPMPVAAADPDAALPDVLAVLNDVLGESFAFTVEGQRAVFVKIAEIQQALADHIGEASSVAA